MALERLLDDLDQRRGAERPAEGRQVLGAGDRVGVGAADEQDPRELRTAGDLDQRPQHAGGGGGVGGGVEQEGHDRPISGWTVPLAQFDRVLLRVRVEHLVAGQPQARRRQLGRGRIRVVVQNPGLGRAGRGWHGCGKGYSESAESW
ncbi:hypothetical protein [Nannocystis pusilla]|uniref:hypothetical protein n=1 Tax=Nannocystis pusilla TaxID=889268 RepID=UPI003DA34ECA